MTIRRYAKGEEIRPGQYVLGYCRLPYTMFSTVGLVTEVTDKLVMVQTRTNPRAITQKNGVFMVCDTHEEAQKLFDLSVRQRRAVLDCIDLIRTEHKRELYAMIQASE